MEMKEETNEFDCGYTDDLVCPYCGYIDRDSWEVGDDDGEWDCKSCGKSFNFERHISVSYSTFKKREKKND